MDNETFFKQFEELERKIESLINASNTHETANLELNNKIERLEKELRGKVEAEESYNREKELIRSKIDNLLVKFNQVEND